MQMFLKMIEVARQGGLREATITKEECVGSNDSFLRVESYLKESVALKKLEESVVTRKLHDHEWTTFAENRPFVFINPPETSSMSVKEATDRGWELAKLEIDAPFPQFSIENYSGNPLVALIGNRGPSFTWCILVDEIAPKEYVYYSLVSLSNDPNDLLKLQNFRVLKTREWEHLLVDIAVSGWVNEFLQMLPRQQMGIQKTKQTIKVGTGSSKRIHRIRQVIHVAPKSYIDKNPDAHREVNWTHRFEVCGHWRKIPGKIGKDRHGNYNQLGHTWVRHHVRGDESLPLVKKTRVVSDNSTADIDPQNRKEVTS